MTGADPRIAVRIDLNPGRLVNVVSLVAAALVLLHVVVKVASIARNDARLYGLVFLFDLNVERNIPSLYSGILLLANAALLLQASRMRSQGAAPRIGWLPLSIVFLFLAYDEMFGLHERLTEPLHVALQTTGLFRFAWTLIYGAGVIVAACLFLPLWWGLAMRERRGMALAGGLYIAGALVMEMLGGAVYERHGGGDPLYLLLVTLEESLEMVGQICFMNVLLRQLGRPVES